MSWSVCARVIIFYIELYFHSVYYNIVYHVLYIELYYSVQCIITRAKHRFKFVVLQLQLMTSQYECKIQEGIKRKKQTLLILEELLYDNSFVFNLPAIPLPLPDHITSCQICRAIFSLFTFSWNVFSKRNVISRIFLLKVFILVHRHWIFHYIFTFLHFTHCPT